MQAYKLKKQLSKIPFLVVAESIEKPGNLGTILRSADGAGADALILCDERTDLFNPNVVRASVGTLFTIPVICASSLETAKFLKDNNHNKLKKGFSPTLSHLIPLI